MKQLFPIDPNGLQLHNSKVLQAIDKLNNLLTLPTDLTTHTPFVICMIGLMTIAHFSACNYLFQGQALEIERQKIRLKMGALKALGEHWELGKRTYRELGVIAREILKLADREIPPLQMDMPQITLEYPGIDFDAAAVFDPCATFVAGDSGLV